MRLHSTATPTATATTTTAATSMRAYQNQTTAHDCASIFLGEKERSVVDNGGDHGGFNHQNADSFVLGYPNYTTTTGARYPMPHRRAARLKCNPPKPSWF